jgi:(R,R)-butanediol dehydrogenase / meso-butanediol dehydrogenase / diacetyl reductase
VGIEARYDGVGRIGIRETPDESPAAGEVRVRIERCGICGSDLHSFRGHSELPPCCPGHEMSGVIDAVGAGARGVREGDRVAVEPLSRCGKCRHCTSGNYHLCGRLMLFGVGAPGGMASHVHVPDYALFPLPSSLDFELGALAEPMAVTIHAARLGGIKRGSRVLVLGAGTIGLVAAAAARHLGASYVAISARHPQQKELALDLGVDEVLDPERLRTAGEKPDVVLETVGGTATTIADGTLAVARGGTIVMIGLFEKTPVFDPGVMILKEVRLVGSMVYNRPATGGADFDVALECIADQADALRGLVTHTFPLTDVQRAFETAADKSSGAVKVMLAPGA